MVQARNMAYRLLLVNHSAKIIYHYDHHQRNRLKFPIFFPLTNCICQTRSYNDDSDNDDNGNRDDNVIDENEKFGSDNYNNDYHNNYDDNVVDNNDYDDNGDDQIINVQIFLNIDDSRFYLQMYIFFLDAITIYQFLYCIFRNLGCESGHEIC